MRTVQSAILLILLVASGLLSGSCAMQEGSTPVSGTVSTAAPSTSVGGTGTAASGTQGDSLQACMARIPQDASAGQRMLAEQSCQRDQANRQEILVVPGAK